MNSNKAILVLAGVLVAGTARGQTDDAVIGVVAPQRAAIPSDKPDIDKNVRIRVANGNREGAHTILVSAEALDCPAGTIKVAPDFEPGTDGVQAAVTLDAGKARQAVMTLNVSTAFLTFNRYVPNRCRIRLTAASVTSGNTDPTPDNNESVFELNVLDLSDDEQTAVHETFVESYRAAHPGKIEIFAGNVAKTDRVRITVANGDLGESPGDVIVVAADDGDCPPGTVGVPDFDPKQPGSQNSVVVEGGKRMRGALTLTVHADDFYSPTRQSLARCTANVTVAGPGGDSDGTNNTTRVTIGVFDRNDL